MTKRTRRRNKSLATALFFLTYLLFQNDGLPIQNKTPLSWAGTPSERFEITDIKLCRNVDENRRPIEITSKFPAGTQTIEAWFAWKNAQSNREKIIAKWYYTSEDIHILDFPVTLTRRSDSGVILLKLPPGKTLPSGSYRLDIEVGGKTVKSADFTVLSPLAHE